MNSIWWKPFPGASKDLCCISSSAMEIKTVSFWTSMQCKQSPLDCFAEYGSHPTTSFSARVLELYLNWLQNKEHLAKFFVYGEVYSEWKKCELCQIKGMSRQVNNGGFVVIKATLNYTVCRRPCQDFTCYKAISLLRAALKVDVASQTLTLQERYYWFV